MAGFPVSVRIRVICAAEAVFVDRVVACFVQLLHFATGHGTCWDSKVGG